MQQQCETGKDVGKTFSRQGKGSKKKKKQRGHRKKDARGVSGRRANLYFEERER